MKYSIKRIFGGIYSSRIKILSCVGTVDFDLVIGIGTIWFPAKIQWILIVYFFQVNILAILRVENFHRKSID
ncbi:MAG: hypothetical protein M0P75_08580, partial [Candidatus Marinimicrobia bacterium]|nr:hypothetical protein [Candidatus Neomarinimicrobiota bacterium]